MDFKDEIFYCKTVVYKLVKNEQGNCELYVNIKTTILL